jgi:hypothetical protein
MKLNFSKLKKNRLPSLKTLRPPIFDVDKFWFVSLGVALVIFLIEALIGFRLMYSQYFENYKESASQENYENLININKLTSAISKRADFLRDQIDLPRDPSS